MFLRTPGLGLDPCQGSRSKTCVRQELRGKIPHPGNESVQVRRPLPRSKMCCRKGLPCSILKRESQAASDLALMSSGLRAKPGQRVSSMRPATSAEVAQRRNAGEELGPPLAE